MTMVRSLTTDYPDSDGVHASSTMTRMRSVGLFSGVGGFELGLQRAGITTELLCEHWEPAAEVLTKRFDAEVVGDIRAVSAIPTVDVVVAGFPCTDLSQVGRTAGIDGVESGLVREAMRLIDRNPPRWVVFENVPNMLTLGGGAAIAFIAEWFEQRGWNWAYRTVDSQHFGLRQRRRRVFLVASRTEDPRGVLFADEAGTPVERARHAAYGFYWTEGNRGVGWGNGVTPTLKGGSKIGIASPPAVWRVGAGVGQAISRPTIDSGERLQGFRAGWTGVSAREGVRWKMIGNAVSVPVAAWVGAGLVLPRSPVEVRRTRLATGRPWPSAASGVDGHRESWDLSERPVAVRPRSSLSALLVKHGSAPLSLGATRGFTERFMASKLRRRPEFVDDLIRHIDYMASS